MLNTNNLYKGPIKGKNGLLWEFRKHLPLMSTFEILKTSMRLDHFCDHNDNSNRHIVVTTRPWSPAILAALTLDSMKLNLVCGREESWCGHDC